MFVEPNGVRRSAVGGPRPLASTGDVGGGFVMLEPRQQPHDDSGAYPWAAVEQAGWAAGNLAIGSHRAQAALVEAGAVQPLISAVNATLASLDLLAQPPPPRARMHWT